MYNSKYKYLGILGLILGFFGIFLFSEDLLAQTIPKEVAVPESVNLDHREISPDDFDIDQILQDLQSAGDDLESNVRDNLARTGDIFEVVPGIPARPESGDSETSSKPDEPSKPEPSKPALSDIEELQNARENLARIVFLSELQELSSGARNTALKAQQSSLDAELSWQNSVIGVKNSHKALQDQLIDSPSVAAAFSEFSEKGIQVSGLGGNGVRVIEIPVPMDEFTIDYLGVVNPETNLDKNLEYVSTYMRFDFSDCQGKKLRGENCQFVWRWRKGGLPLPITVVISFKNLDSGLYHKIPVLLGRAESGDLADSRGSRDSRDILGSGDSRGNSEDSGNNSNPSNLAPLAGDRGDRGDRNPGPPQNQPRPPAKTPQPQLPEVPEIPVEVSGGSFSDPQRTRIRYFREGQVALDLAHSEGRGGVVRWNSVIVSEGDKFGEKQEWEVVRVDPDNYRVILHSVSKGTNFVVSRTRRFRNYVELKQDLSR